MSSILFGLALALACLGAEEPLFEGLGSYTRTITTSLPEAQRYFNQGLAFLHGFNHGAAIRSFQRAAELDPECAMAHWAIALASGPHINYPLVPPPAAERAWKELGLAQQYAPHASPVERELIEALSHRYAKTAALSIALMRTRCARCGKNIQTIRMSACSSRRR
jgi:hypothetical protein